MKFFEIKRSGEQEQIGVDGFTHRNSTRTLQKITMRVIDNLTLPARVQRKKIAGGMENNCWRKNESHLEVFVLPMERFVGRKYQL